MICLCKVLSLIRIFILTAIRFYCDIAVLNRHQVIYNYNFDKQELQFIIAEMWYIPVFELC